MRVGRDTVARMTFDAVLLSDGALVANEAKVRLQAKQQREQEAGGG